MTTPATPTTDDRAGWTSASNALYDSLCAGRHIAQKNLPEKQGEYALTGSRIHEALAKQDPAGLTLEETETYDACREIEAAKVREFFGDDAPKVKAFRETRYWMPDRPRYQHSGKVDVVFRYGPRALINEYKTLLGDVPESSKNQQLRDQAVLVYGNLVGLAEIGTLVTQPLVTRSPAICLYKLDDLRAALEQLCARVIASNDPAAKRTPGKPQCDFCKAKTLCVEYNKWTGSLIPLVTEPVVQEAIFQVAMANWTPEQRAVAAGLISPAMKMLEEMKAFLKEGLHQDPSFIPGWMLSKGRQSETITDAQVCFDRFAALGGSLPDYMQTLKVGKTKLKEAVSKLTGAKGKALDKAIGTLTEGIVSVSTSEGSLTKVD